MILLKPPPAVPDTTVDKIDTANGKKLTLAKNKLLMLPETKKKSFVEYIENNRKAKALHLFL